MRRRRGLTDDVVDEREQEAALDALRSIELGARVPTSNDLRVIKDRRRFLEALRTIDEDEPVAALAAAVALAEDFGAGWVARVVELERAAYLATDGRPWTYRSPTPTSTTGSSA